MGLLEAQLKDIKKQEKEIKRQIDKRNADRKIHCSCGEYHKIKKLTAIQTHWYTPPRGCTEGDYWNEGEMQFICPKTKVKNRIIFDNNDIPREERKKYENNPEAQFRTKYRRLFRKVVDEYGETFQGEWENNFYVDMHRREFNLVEKRK